MRRHDAGTTSAPVLLPVAQTPSPVDSRPGSGEVVLSMLERQPLPSPMTRTMSSRMRLDATMNPNMLHLRMNNQNILKELLLHKGQMVSNQYSLMKPRRKATSQKPQELELPSFCSKAFAKKMQKKLAKERQPYSAAGSPTSEAAGGDLASNGAFPGSRKEKSRRAIIAEDSIGGHSGFLGFGTERSSIPAINEGFDRVHAMTEPGNTQVALQKRLEQVFSSMEASPGAGLPHARIARSLSALGFQDINNDIIKSALAEMQTTSSTLTLEEFTHVVQIFEQHRSQDLKSLFEALDEDRSGSISARELRHLLWDLGYTVSMDTVELIVAEVDADRSGQIEIDEFYRCICVINERHGFTKEEMFGLLNIFDKYDVDKSGEISADELACALAYFGTPTSFERAQIIVDTFDSDGKGTLARPEFLRVMRMRLEQEISDVRDLFAEYDVDLSGSIDESEMMHLIHRIGYSILPSVVEEVVSDQVKKINPDDGLVFEDILKVLHKLHKQEGFSKSEVADLQEVFTRHDTEDNEELREFELAHALTWLGYPISQQRRRQLWCKVDVDKTDSIDESEFLKLIRLLREEEVVFAKQTLEEAGNLKDSNSAQAWLKETGIMTMLNRMGYCPPDALLAKALKTCGGEGELSLINILEIVKMVREEQVTQLRQSAGLPDRIANKIRGKFGPKIEAGKRIDPMDIEKLMFEIFKSARNRPEQRAKIRKQIQESTTHAEGTYDLNQIFWLVRNYGDNVAEEAWRAEEEAAKAGGFDQIQVSVFRQEFVLQDEDGDSYLNEEGVYKAFDNLIKMTTAQTAVLARQMDMIGDDEKDCVDFAEFIRIMRFVLKGSMEREKGKDSRRTKDAAALKTAVSGLAMTKQLSR
eukprot:TRINITY_DN81127_c0_g1_i1.p1 TRINITY_DN81127_c0_g1~~TRINITY_DN81127_c0_g1_i1.p1  ORF type:complete len:871 (-),score=299.74 TRINITY_DN81127_c0_g1_i1:41-2653(-)